MIDLSYKAKLISIKFIIFLFLFKIYYNDCISHSFEDLNYPKGFTLENGYHLMVTSKGIYSFSPGLTSINSYYNFTDEQKMSTDINTMADSINQIEISQFSGEDGGKKYVICLANDFIYFITEKGRIMYYQKIPDLNADYAIQLIAYKYYDEKYYFVIAFNYYSLESQKNILVFRYYKIITNNRNYNILLDGSLNFEPTSNTIHITGLSCHVMKSAEKGKLLTCFEGIEYTKNIVAYSFDPDNGFYSVLNSEPIQIIDNKDATNIKSAINKERTIVLICYTVESEDKIKCIYYNINNNNIK